MSSGTAEAVERIATLVDEGKAAEALALLEEAEAQDPDAVVLTVQRARCRLSEGDRAAAVQDYRSAAQAYAERGALTEAIALYKLVASLTDGVPMAGNGDVPLLRDLVHRYQRFQEAAINSGADDSRTDPLDSPLFKDLSREELEGMLESTEPVRYARGSVVFKEGEPGASLCIIMRGFVRVSSASAEGERLELARLGPGDFFGEWSLIAGEYRRNAWVEATTEVELLELSREAIEQISSHFPNVRDRLETIGERRQLDTLLARVFPLLPSADRRRLADQMSEAEGFRRGTIIFREGDLSGHMSIVQQGTVEVYTTNLDGVKVKLALLGPGQYFGEGAALSGAPRTASVKARTDVILRQIPREALVQTLMHYPDVLDALQGVRAERLSDTLNRLTGDNIESS